MESCVYVTFGRNLFDVKKSGSILIQSHVRGHQTCQFCHQIHSSEKIQSLLKMFRTQNEYLNSKQSAIVIQKIFRGRHDRIYCNEIRSSEAIG